MPPASLSSLHAGSPCPSWCALRREKGEVLVGHNTRWSPNDVNHVNINHVNINHVNNNRIRLDYDFITRHKVSNSPAADRLRTD
jgi:hypothetical protein